MKRIMIYSHDTFGLGNIRRMLEVARHLVQASESVSVLVITGSPMLHAFRIPDRIDYVKLPCLARDVHGRYGARSLPMSLDATVRLRANLIRSAMADFEPDLILVDKKPFGVEDELSGALSSLAVGAARPKLVLLLRDILDSAESTVPIWRRNGYFDAIGALYDQVLVVGSPEVFDLRREYAFPPLAAAKVRFCGYIAREPGRVDRTRARQALGVAPAQPLVVVTPGGGEDGHALIDQALQAAALWPCAQRPRIHFICGPELAEDLRATVHARAAALPGVSVQDFCDDMMSLLAAADVVLAMGGYNTVCELLTLRRRAVLVPRVQPGTEQLIRAERMAARGLLQVLHPAQVNAQRLQAALQDEIDAQARGVQRPALQSVDGLGEVTRHLFTLLDHTPALPPALSTADSAFMPFPTLGAGPALDRREALC